MQSCLLAKTQSANLYSCMTFEQHCKVAVSKLLNYFPTYTNAGRLASENRSIAWCGGEKSSLNIFAVWQR